LYLVKHLLIGIKISIMFMIPDEYAAITLAKKRNKYESIEALKKEVILKFLILSSQFDL